MKKFKLVGIALFFIGLFHVANAQSTNYVGNWESTTPVAQYNNLTLRVQISSTSDPNVFILVNADAPKGKFSGKYNAAQDRLYTTFKKKPIYLKYDASADKLECFKSKDDTKLYELSRY
jgi:hypothetical protein